MLEYELEDQEDEQELEKLELEKLELLDEKDELQLEDELAEADPPHSLNSILLILEITKLPSSVISATSPKTPGSRSIMLPESASLRSNMILPNSSLTRRNDEPAPENLV